MTKERLALLTTEEMARVDARSVELGVSGGALMENAGRAVAEAARAMAPGGRVAVLCGPGNNGGDGYVAARILAETGASVRLAALAPPASPDAIAAAQGWTGPVAPLEDGFAGPSDLVIDALFGAGLRRALAGQAAAFAEKSAGFRVLAVDVPSGLPGNGEAPSGPVVRACATITFMTKKPAHVLMPGRALCGEVAVADIGAPPAALDEIGARLFENAPALWPSLPRWPSPESHKHARGKVAVWAKGPRASATLGAQRLAARAAQRLAGWVSLYVEPQDLTLAVEPASLVVRADDDVTDHDAIVFGCGAAVGDASRVAALDLAGTGRALVLDAGALSSFERRGGEMFGRLSPRTVLTPHAGEFARLFADDALRPTKIAQARSAAARAGAVVLLKGYDTVIAAPDGRCAVNTNATPWLASAGTGDVLAGMIAGLLASGAEAFEAACAGAWLHAESGARAGPGLIADDLVTLLPGVLDTLAPDALRGRRRDAYL